MKGKFKTKLIGQGHLFAEPDIPELPKAQRQRRERKCIGIVGDRRRNGLNDFMAVATALHKLYRRGDVIVSGGAILGADRFAEVLIDVIGCDYIIHRPDRYSIDQELLGINSRAAFAAKSYQRNDLVARDSDYLIACVVEGQKRSSTADTIRKWKRMHPGYDPDRLIIV